MRGAEVMFRAVCYGCGWRKTFSAWSMRPTDCDQCGGIFFWYLVPTPEPLVTTPRREFWCRWASCQKTIALPGGADLPAVCVHCHRPARWMTGEPTDQTILFSDEEIAIDGWVLTFNDRRFLRSIRVSAEPSTAAS